MRIQLLIILTLAASHGWALDDAAVRKKIEELKSEDPKVRAAAVIELTPLYVELHYAVISLYGDQSREVNAAAREMGIKLGARMQNFGEEMQKKNANNPEFAGMRMVAKETAAAKACISIGEAQEIYKRTDYDADGVREYALALKGDYSLIENKAGTGNIALIDRALADASGDPAKATPKAGYLFRILTRQGSAVKEGAQDYLVNGNLVNGYAVVAYPAEYGKTGKHTFVMNKSGVLFTKDLGDQTSTLAAKMDEYNPDASWVPME